MAAAGCWRDGVPLTDPRSPRDLYAAALRARAAEEFDAALLVKPRMDVDAGIDPYLAPLLYLETPGDGARLPAVPGRASVGRDGELAIDVSVPTVYFAEGPVDFRGAPSRQLSFVWFRAHAPTPQGVRITLDERGHPALAEVLADTRGMRVVFASSDLEEAATRELGAAASERAFALEPPDAELVLAGLFEPGPMPMGPYVYLPLGTGDVASLLCRCEPSRSREVSGTIEYELTPLALLEGVWPPEGASDELPWGPPEAALAALDLPAADG